MHVLAFDEDLFKLFINPPTSKLPALNLPNLVQFAREFYNCSSIQSLPLENDGNKGSANNHWEKMIFFNEFMIPDDVDD